MPLTLNADGDAVIDFGAHEITLEAGDNVEIKNMKLLNTEKTIHSLTAQILIDDTELAADTVGFSF